MRILRDISIKLAFLFSFVILLHIEKIAAQPECYFEHYGAENGLPQQTIMDILQDQKGFIWLSTWDGLSKFDGHNFKTFRIPHTGNFQVRSNRIDNIFEDKYGNIWTLSYDNRAHRFNPLTERFTDIHSLDYYKDKDFFTTAIIPQKSGKVWLLSENNGCISITDSIFSAEIYNIQNGRLAGNTVHIVYEDKELNSWILTNKGILHVPYIKTDSAQHLFNKMSAVNDAEIPFYSILEVDEQIWFGSENGVIWIFNKKNKEYLNIDATTDSDIISLMELSSEKILAVTRDDGFLIYNTHSGDWNTYNTRTLAQMASNEIFNCYVDRSRNIWLETNTLGVSKFNPYTESFIHFTPTLESTESSVFPPNYFIFEDKENRLWVHPRGGGFSLFDKERDKLIPFYNEPFSPDWRFSNMLHSAYSDRQGNLWMCTRSHGLEKIIFYENDFKTFLIDNNIHSTVSNDVRPIFQDSKKNIWVATKDGRIYMYDQNFQKKGHLGENGAIGNSNPLKGIAYCFMEDSSQQIWIGTKGEGVYKLTRTNDSDQFRIENYKHILSDPQSLSNNNVYSIYQDKNGQIWIGTYGGGINLLHETSSGVKFIHSQNDLTNYPYQSGSQVRIISEDKFGNVCVGTTLGLIMFSPDSHYRNIQYHLILKESFENSIKANDIFDICTTAKGETYIGTFGGGISKIEETDEYGFPLSFKTYDINDGLPSNITLSVLEDDSGNLWISTEGNLTKFNPQKESFENFSEVKRLMKRQAFSENSRNKTIDGKILFGYSNGIMIFSPKNLKNNTYVPYLSLSQFKIFNKEILINENTVLKNNIDDVNQLILKHNQNFFSIDFAALDYVEPNNILYAYRLDGFDKDWIYSGTQRTANYTNLSKGKYTFRVKSTNSDGVWIDNERVLPIEIRPPYWATTWAYLIYFILIATLIYYVTKILYAFYRMRNKIILEERESEIKTRFFTDISHEIRTPLTMIVSPIDNILQNTGTPENIKKQLNLVSKNTTRLLNMVNQILDFQKIQQKTLHIEKIEIGKLVEEISNGFAKNAEANNINFIVENKFDEQIIWADSESVEKIVINLLSNAFKYTAPGKKIKISVFDNNNSVALKVEDEGKGIAPDKQERIFKRFESFNEDKSKPSTGIGLSIIKELADKHKAKIQIQSELNKGSTFTVLFQKGFEHFGADTVIHSQKKTENKVITVNQENNSIYTPDITGEIGKPSILVVEDDDDLRTFICSILENDYEVSEASDGRQGLEKAKEIIPDFIVSDIMMPEVDGIGFLKSVRSNINTSHILFLLLTAKTTLDSKLEGFEHGADEYITKPFSVSYFKARVKNLLERREQLQKFYRNSGVLLKNEEIILEDSAIGSLINKQDAEFLKAVNTIIEKNIDNSDFVVEDLANEVAMSRTVFFKKLKGLTGQSPIEYIRNIVMQQAARLLISGKYTVKEVSYMVGISDPKYFTKCFKKQFRTTPSEYKNNAKKYQTQLQ